MKKIILSAAILFALNTATQAQFSTGNLLNKAKEKAKQKAEEKARQEAEKAFTKSNKKEDKKDDKNTPVNNTSTNETMTDEQTTTAPAADYSGMNNAAYVKALGKKENTALVLWDLNGGNAEAINKYYNDAAEVDLANFYPVMVKKGKPSGFDGVSDYESLIKLYKEYPEIYETKFKPAINQTLDGAYQVMKTNRALAVANLEVANHLNEACLLIVPDLKDAIELRGELNKALTTIGAEHAKVFTSDFHRKNAGKILFSKEPIVPVKKTLHSLPPALALTITSMPLLTYMAPLTK
jgi:hypothetical protein